MRLERVGVACSGLRLAWPAQRRATFLILFTIACLSASFGVAVAVGEPVFGRPIYDPNTKSYFELVQVPFRNYNGRYECSWGDADKLARQRVYKGVHGRLAVVKSEETHEFLLQKFDVPQAEVWIGLRYWCSIRQLQYTDGTIWKRGMFSAWDQRWDQSGVTPCAEWITDKKQQYMPVAYSKRENGFRWIAKEWHKFYEIFFVEYPTGHE
jgi:hypothetical protein